MTVSASLQEPVLCPEDDPQGAAIHEATEAIHRLYELLAPETAHWIATVAIINADRAARSKHHV